MAIRLSVPPIVAVLANERLPAVASSSPRPKLNHFQSGPQQTVSSVRYACPSRSSV